MIVALITLALVGLLLCIALVIGYDQIVVSKVPFKRLKPETTREILTSLQINPNSTVYDLGCGDGRVLVEAAKIQPRSTYVGIEKAIIPYVLAKYQTRHFTQIHIHLGDVRKCNFTDATYIFVYLLPNLIDSLESDFKKLIKKQTCIVAVEFPLKSIKPISIHELTHRSEFASKWYQY